MLVLVHYIMYIGLLKKWGAGVGHNKSSQMGAIKAIEQDVTQRIKNVCEHMLKHNVIEVQIIIFKKIS